ncbi:class I SAM-dependent methyltransferase [Microvirga sp. Mcv34]|uniref:class I SAM-dependent methyltransferase n=1 Tax=Microvirga sp. Mcv34 TaxID=2926016 RepID=UPI0021C6418C|nr:class I SAM-dependent methyltransferase [Microvirga sp. Mcv34]
MASLQSDILRSSGGTSSPIGPGRTLVDVARSLNPSRGEFSKPYDFYDFYEPYFSPLRERDIRFLEVGVYEGESTKVFSRYFERGSIVGIDLQIRDIDFRGFKNVTYLKANQTDGDALSKIAVDYAPDGFDIILDDASHVGYFSLLTFLHVFPRLKPGGIYIVEDWGTGYWNTWPDGGSFQRFPVESYQGEIPKRLISHDHGMVGFVKLLVDIAAGGDIKGEGPFPNLGPHPFQSMNVYPGTVVIRKSER